jgi:predicted HTH domain antitoxin
MPMATLTLTFPDDLEEVLGRTPAEAGATLRLMAALKLYELGRVSAGWAAELAGLDKVAFLEVASRHGAPAYNYPEEELDKQLAADLAALDRALGR